MCQGVKIKSSVRSLHWAFISQQIFIFVGAGEIYKIDKYLSENVNETNKGKGVIKGIKGS